MLYEIMHKDVPALYELGVGDQGKELILDFHPAVAESATELISSCDNKQAFTGLELEPFKSPTKNSDMWGFGDVLKRLPNPKNDWIRWGLRLPCGNGKFSEDEWKKWFGASATLNLLFRAASLFNGDTGYERPQLMDLTLVTEDRLHGGSIGCKLAQALVPYLASQPDGFYHPSLTAVMKQAFETMVGRKAATFMDRFRVYFRQPKWINLDVPGNATGLDPENYYVFDDTKDWGYIITSHNVDGPVQQLSLVMGLAGVYDEARKFGC